MSDVAAVETPSTEVQPASFTPEAGIGVPLSVGAFGFAVLVLGFVTANIVTSDAGAIFVPVALGTGALGLFIGGLWEYRANNVFGGTFALFYSAFLLTTGLILRFFADPITDAAGDNGFGDAFGMWLLLWCVFTLMLSYGAYYINMPAFLAFILLALGYLVLGIANINNGADTTLTKFGGWVLIVDGIVAWYLSWALAVNPLVARKLPLWPHPYSRRSS
ncbi:MAG: acetate uptake transporter [Acidimicrobiales bacterium]